ncbi:MAG: hypothetical protein Q7S18_01380 [bacterium]|nr:hypothetical protein [bacterium]
MQIKNRKRNRLQNYDYSQNGLYFVTVCTKDRIECFGKIKNGEITLNELGKIVEKCWLEIPNHFSNSILGEFIIMPNHVHGIVEINNILPKFVGNAYMRSLPYNRTKMSLSKIIHGFKSSATREINKKNDTYFQWQRSFYDHIVRNDISLNKIR